MRPFIISQQLFSFRLLSAVLLFTLFFSSSCALAATNEDGSGRSYQHLRHARGVIRGAVGARAVERVKVAGLDLERRRQSSEGDLLIGREEGGASGNNNAPRSPSATEGAAVPAHVVRDCLAQITPAPSLSKRQDQGQINALSGEIQRLSESFRSVSQASQQVSQSSQQLSQSLQQATQRLIQTEASIASLRVQKDLAEQASRSATQAANDASRRADEASASASRAISAAFSEASRSASEMMAQVTREMAASASSAVAAASESAILIANSAASRIQQAQAEATSVRNDAQSQSQVQEAPGAAVSVTQVALAVVGGIVASSLITVVVVVLVMRYRRKRKQKKSMMAGRFVSGGGGGGNNNGTVTAVRGPPMGDYKMADYDNESNYSSSSPPPSSRYSAVGYPPDIKEPLPVLDRSNSGGGAARKPGVGVGTGGPGGFKLGDPPAPKSNNKFTLFPSPSTSSPKGGSSGSPNARGSKSMFPTLDTWLRNGTSVSPFATVNKGAAAVLGDGAGVGAGAGAAVGVGIAKTTEGRKSPEWPIRRS